MILRTQYNDAIQYNGFLCFDAQSSNITVAGLQVVQSWSCIFCTVNVCRIHTSFICCL